MLKKIKNYIESSFLLALVVLFLTCYGFYKMATEESCRCPRGRYSKGSLSLNRKFCNKKSGIEHRIYPKLGKRLLNKNNQNGEKE